MAPLTCPVRAKERSVPQREFGAVPMTVPPKIEPPRYAVEAAIQLNSILLESGSSQLIASPDATSIVYGTARTIVQLSDSVLALETD